MSGVQLLRLALITRASNRVTAEIEDLQERNRARVAAEDADTERQLAEHAAEAAADGAGLQPLA